MLPNRPSLQEIIDRIENDINQELGTSSVLRRAFSKVISRALGAMIHLLFGFLDWIFEQAFLITATSRTFIRWWGITFGVEIREATFAEFDIAATGNQGAIIPDGTIYTREDGTQYVSVGEETLDINGEATVRLNAINSGSAPNVEVNDTISLNSTIAGVDSDATVSNIVTNAEDEEDLELYRQRILNRIQLPPLGGSANDYIQWALEVSGVTRSWVLPLNQGPGTVGVSFVNDNADPIIPGSTKVDEVDTYIKGLKPVTAQLTVFAPAPLDLDIDISIQPNTSEVQQNITNELNDLIKRDANLAGSYKGPGQTNDGKILLSKIRLAIGLAVGLEDYEINTINGSAPDNVTPSQGELIVPGTFSWQTLS